MSPPPNELYTAFSFIGFVLSVIPFYWHLEAWNTGTCLYMIWTGLGCLLQCINSIVWNKNIINRAPIYCDFATRIQVALNVAIPACSLCINRRLHKIATVRAVVIGREEKRKAVIQDLLIGVGLPILQIIAQYIISSNRYNIFEDFGPAFASTVTPLTFILFTTWPVVIGFISCYYCVTTTYTFYNRQRQFSQLMSATPGGLSRGRYLRLMAIGAVEVIGTIPLGTYFIVTTAKSGVKPWVSWADTHSNYSAVAQVAGFIWKHDPMVADGLEIYRWSLVVCAFLFFALFGFADEARQCYRRMYTTLASRIGVHSMFTLHGSSHATTSVPFVKSKGGVSVSVVTTTGDKRISSISFTERRSMPAISIARGNEPDYKIEPFELSNSMAASSVDNFELKMQDQSTLQAGIMPMVPPASVPPHFSDMPKHPYAGADAV